MIIDQLCTWFFNFLNWLVDSIVPTVPRYVPGVSELGGFAELCTNAAFFLPLTAMGLCIMIIVGVQLSMNGLWVINWMIKRVRGG